MEARAAPARREPVRGDFFRRDRGFTFVELMVVMGIIVLAAGLMTPTIAEFFKNRQLDGVRGEFGSVFQRARLRAVTEGRDVSVVFFAEGPRVFDERSQTFRDGNWSPEASALSGESTLWYVLGFAGETSSYDERFADNLYRPRPPYVPPYYWWEKQQSSHRENLKKQGVDVRDDQYDISDLFKVMFHRDGTLSFGAGGTDIPSSTFDRKDSQGRDLTPERADIVIYQENSNSACFLDLRMTGQVRSKTPALRISPIKKGKFSLREEGS